MKKQKTIKSIAKRFKTTSKGKVLKLKNGQNHLNAKENGKTTRAKRKEVLLDDASGKNIKKILNK